MDPLALVEFPGYSVLWPLDVGMAAGRRVAGYAFAQLMSLLGYAYGRSARHVSSRTTSRH
jgi:hypothetical protein